MVVALPSHTSHATQPLDNGLFSATKQRFKHHMSLRMVSSKSDMRQDVLTVFAIITKAYDEGLTVSNVKGGFRGAEIWPLDATKLL